MSPPSLLILFMYSLISGSFFSRESSATIIRIEFLWVGEEFLFGLGLSNTYSPIFLSFLNRFFFSRKILFYWIYKSIQVSFPVLVYRLGLCIFRSLKNHPGDNAPFHYLKKISKRSPCSKWSSHYPVKFFYRQYAQWRHRLRWGCRYVILVPSTTAILCEWKTV